MATPDLAEASRLVTGLGGTTIAGPVVADIPGAGSAELATFLGPEGECIEIYQEI